MINNLLFRKPRFRAAAAMLAAAALFVLLAPALAADVSPGHWAAPYTSKAQAYGWIDGELGAGFDVDAKVRRSEMGAVLWRAFGSEAPTAGIAFADVPENSAYAAAASYLAEKSIVLGYGDGRWGPEDYVTRDMIFSVVARVFGLVPANPDAYLLFSDAPDIDIWATGAVSALLEQKIVSGYEDGAVRGKDTLSFAELIKILVATNDKYEGQPNNPLVAGAAKPAGAATEDIGEESAVPGGAAEVAQAQPGVMGAAAGISANDGQQQAFAAATVTGISVDSAIIISGESVGVTLSGYNLDSAASVRLLGADGRAVPAAVAAGPAAGRYVIGPIAEPGSYIVAAYVSGERLVSAQEAVSVLEGTVYGQRDGYSLTLSYLFENTATPLTIVIIAPRPGESERAGYVVTGSLGADSAAYRPEYGDYVAVLDGVQTVGSIAVTALA